MNCFYMKTYSEVFLGSLHKRMERESILAIYLKPGTECALGSMNTTKGSHGGTCREEMVGGAPHTITKQMA